MDFNDFEMLYLLQPLELLCTLSKLQAFHPSLPVIFS